MITTNRTSQAPTPYTWQVGLLIAVVALGVGALLAFGGVLITIAALLATAAGLSNPLIFLIGTLPEVTAPVVTATSVPQRRGQTPTATKRGAPLDITLPAVVNGQILPGEIDTLRFTARRGQQLTVALHARALIPYLAPLTGAATLVSLALLGGLAAARQLALDPPRLKLTPTLLVTLGGCAFWHAVISIKKQAGEGKNALLAALSVMDLKHVVVVDDDIDVRNWQEVIWAMTTRVDAARDTLIAEHTPIDYLDFASPVAGLGSKMGIDATNKWPGETNREWGRPIVMDAAVKQRIDSLWNSLGL